MTANNVSPGDIVNFSLGYLGAGRIVSLSDSSEKAVVMNLYYEHTRNSCLNVLNWQFARKRASLASLSEKPVFEYDYQYALPSDFLKLYQVGDYYPMYNDSLIVNANTALYTIEGNKILTNLQAPLNIKYTADISDTTQFTPLFIKFFSLELAINACEQLTQSNTKKSELYTQSKDILNKASLADKTQYPPQQFPTGAFLDSRIR